MLWRSLAVSEYLDQLFSTYLGSGLSAPGSCWGDEVTLVKSPVSTDRLIKSENANTKLRSAPIFSRPRFLDLSALKQYVLYLGTYVHMYLETYLCTHVLRRTPPPFPYGAWIFFFSFSIWFSALTHRSFGSFSVHMRFGNLGASVHT